MSQLYRPGVLAMDRVLAAAGVDFTPQVAPPGALVVLEMDVSRLGGLVPLAPVDAGRLIREARAGGWHPHGSTNPPA